MMNAVSFLCLMILTYNNVPSAYANWITGNLCWSMPCQNGGSCFGSAYTYLCVCPINYSGALCEKRIGICQESPCGNRGLCVETGQASFECRCYFDYMGPLCEEHVPKNDPSVWSSLIPVHTRVLFDILQEAYRSKSIEKSTKLSDQSHDSDHSFPSVNDMLSVFSPAHSPSVITQTPTNIPESTSSSSKTDSVMNTEPSNVIEGDHFRLEKIFPEPEITSTLVIETSVPTSLNESDQLVTEHTNTIGLSSYADSTLSIMDDESTLNLSSEQTSTLAKELTTLETSTIDFNTETSQTESTIGNSDEYVTNQTENNTSSQEETTRISTTEATTVDLKSYTTVSDKATSLNSFDSTYENYNTRSRKLNLASATDDYTESKATEPVNYETSIKNTEIQSTTIAQLTSTAAMTTEIPIQVEELLKALNSSESLRNRILYNLCRQLLSHILPNNTPISSKESESEGKKLVSNSSISINQTADALLSWINEQLTSSLSTAPTSVMNTKTDITITNESTTENINENETTTEATEVSSISNVPTLVIEDSPSPSMSLQRLDMNEVLGQMINNVDADFLS